MPPKKRKGSPLPDPQGDPLLNKNRYAPLAEVEKKEKLPPFYVRGINASLKTDLDLIIKRGVKATIKLCTDGYKINVPSQQHYNAVEEYLRQKKVEYFSHDIPGMKPFKAVLRGLYEMETDELKAHLSQLGLKVDAIHKIRRKQTNFRFRDQLYLVHLTNGSTCLKDLKAIRAVANVIVEWEKYRPVHRDVTQCTKCFNFGHGARNCHMKPRCEKCGANHEADGCVTDVMIAKCCNCEGDHPSTDRNCPKRAEFVQMRRAAAAKRTPPVKQNQFNLNQVNFPAIQSLIPRYNVPNLQPLPLGHQLGPKNKQEQNLNSGSQNQNRAAGSSQGQFPAAGSSKGQNQSSSGQIPPGFLTFAQVTNLQQPAAEGDAENELYTASELMVLLKGIINLLGKCKTKAEQHLALCEYAAQYIYGL